MDLWQGLHTIDRYQVVAQLRVDRVIGLLFGCLVVGMMIFMMFAILGSLLVGEP
jgi:tetrahydromethanopterin S-methyltransferase subunit G